MPEDCGSTKHNFQPFKTEIILQSKIQIVPGKIFGWKAPAPFREKLQPDRSDYSKAGKRAAQMRVWSAVDQSVGASEPTTSRYTLANVSTAGSFPFCLRQSSSVYSPAPCPWQTTLRTSPELPGTTVGHLEGWSNVHTPWGRAAPSGVNQTPSLIVSGSALRIDLSYFKATFSGKDKPPSRYSYC